MPDFSTIFNQETINTQFLESIKTTFQIFIKLLKMPLPTVLKVKGLIVPFFIIIPLISPFVKTFF